MKKSTTATTKKKSGKAGSGSAGKKTTTRKKAIPKRKRSASQVTPRQKAPRTTQPTARTQKPTVIATPKSQATPVTPSRLVPEKFNMTKVPVPQVDLPARHHRHHTAVWLVLVLITLLSFTAVVYAALFLPRDTSLTDQEIDRTIKSVNTATGSTCGAGYCTPPNNTNSSANINATTDANTNSVVITTTAGTVSLSNGTVGTSCVTADDCSLVDAAYDHADCCTPPNCIEYSDPNFVAVNTESYVDLRAETQTQCSDTVPSCPQYSTPYCPNSQQNSEYSVDCIQNVCQKLHNGDVVPAGE